MPLDIPIPVLLLVFFVLVICAPLIPAVLIYKLFPRQQAGVSGSLWGLTISATGAFAAYVITFILAYQMVQRGSQIIGGMVHPIWKVSAKVKLVDENGAEVANPEWLKGLVVELHPDFYTTANELISVSVPETDGTLPNVVLRIPNFGSNVIDTSNVRLSRNEYTKQINVTDPIIIKKFPVWSGGVANSADK